MKTLLIALLSLAVIGYFVIGQPKVVANEQQISVAATIFPIADWLREIGDPEIRVHLLVNAQASPHHFEPTISDAVNLSHDRVFFAAGLAIDPWANKLASSTGIKFIPVAGWIEPRFFIGKGFNFGGIDPHFWLDPNRAKLIVQHMVIELSIIDPVHADLFASRAAAYIKKLDSLTLKIDQISDIPHETNVITFHDAYGYLFDNLGIKGASIQSSPGIDPSPRDCMEAVRLMRANSQRTVFAEVSDLQRTADLIATEVGPGTKVARLDPLETELSPSTGKTYVERLGYDIDTLHDSLKRP